MTKEREKHDEQADHNRRRLRDVDGRASRASAEHDDLRDGQQSPDRGAVRPLEQFAGDPRRGQGHGQLRPRCGVVADRFQSTANGPGRDQGLFRPFPREQSQRHDRQPHDPHRLQYGLRRRHLHLHAFGKHAGLHPDRQGALLLHLRIARWKMGHRPSPLLGDAGAGEVDSRLWRKPLKELGANEIMRELIARVL